MAGLIPAISLKDATCRPKQDQRDKPGDDNVERSHEYVGYPIIGAVRHWRVSMAQTLVKPRTKLKSKTERPKLWKVILLNDDFTPREFVVVVLKAVFRMNQDEAYNVMITAHRRGACVIAVFTKDVADTKAKEATELGKSKGYPLYFTTEPEE
jgi:ATP-dependent Clp protease adaptor protein ClpS